MEKITAIQLTDFANKCLHCSQNLTAYLTRKAELKQLTPKEKDFIEKQQNKLLECAMELNAKATLITVKDLKNSLDRISQATQRLMDAMEQLQETKKIIGAIAGLVNLVNSVLSAVMTGSPAAIANAISEVEGFV